MLTDAIVIALVGVLAVLLPLSRAYRSYLVGRLATKAKATVPPAQVAALEERITHRARAMGTGILLAGLVMLLVSQVWTGAEEDFGEFLVVSVMFVFGAAGHALADLLRPGTPATGPRTARATSPALTDYLPSPLLVASRVFIGVGMLALVGTLALSRSESFDTATIWRGPIPLLAVAIPALALLAHLAMRRVLDAPQPARDETELYWQDAVRAQTLSALVVTTPFVSLFALVVCGSALDDAASAAAIAAGQVGPQWSLWLLILGYLLPFVLVLGAATLAAAQGSRWSEMQHFRERLWNGQAPIRTHEARA